MQNAKKMDEKTKQKNDKAITIGIVRPISSYGDERTYDHWKNVGNIIQESLYSDEYHSFDVKLVSDEKNADVIQTTIIQNLYASDVVVCDLSSQNANVFFELGIRMAYQKPCVLLVDDKTKVPFDLSVIRYIEYPSSLHYVKVIQLKKDIRESVLNAYHSYQDKSKVYYDSFFTTINVKPESMKEKNISIDEDVNNKLNIIMERLDRISRHRGIDIGDEEKIKRMTEMEMRMLEQKRMAEELEMRLLEQKRKLKRNMFQSSPNDEDIPF